jgi:hypothetical protein
MTEQNFANHTRLVPAFHFFVLPVLLLNVIWSVYRWKTSLFSMDGAIWVLTSVAFLVGFLCARVFALTVQDRVIRVEELRPRIGELTTAQLVSLRFASDVELPELARKVLDEKMKDRKAIKQLVKNWRPDYLRV